MTDALFFGDPHGDFRAVRHAATGLGYSAPSPCIFLGDLDLDVPFEEAAAPLIAKGCDVHYIHGNHEADRVQWYDNLFTSGLADRSLHCRVIEIGGIRYAGLGGVFKGKIWHPKDGDGLPRFRTREEFMQANGRNAWRGGLPLGLRATIFPEDYEKLADMQADVLVTHEAPSCHRYGFSEIDLLAEAMGAKVIVHGHHHEPYRSEISGGIVVIGMGQADVIKLDLSEFVAVPSPVC
jgi:Predicted phosphoesterases, related to the Icc protein